MPRRCSSLWWPPSWSGASASDSFLRSPRSLRPALTFVWPESSLWNSTKEYGYHEIGLVMGLLVIWEAVRIVQAAKIDGKDVVRDWVLLGLAMGIGWWATPETLYFTLPAAVVVALSLRAHRGVGSGHGSLPWRSASSLVRSLGSWPACRVGVAAFGTKTPSPVSYSGRLSTFFTHVLPMLLGLRIEGAGQWEVSPMLGGLLVVLLLAGLVAAMITVAVRVPDAWVLVASLVIFPFLYAAFPTSWFWNDGRYGIALAPIVSLVGIGAIWQLPRSESRVGSVWQSSPLPSSARSSPSTRATGVSPRWPAFRTGVPIPNSAVTTLSAKLQALGVRHVYAGYWVAYDLAFVSAGHIQVAPIVNDRDPSESEAVARAARAGWVFVPPAKVGEIAGQVGSTTGLDPGVVDESSLDAWLTAKGIRFRTATVGPFLLVLPDQNTWPKALLGPETSG